ncbi:MAG: NUDIX hydrolase [Chitinophagaceae bacterium]|nr:NUDIX hydrolase [Chitinophagaceae bacterium]
MNVHDQLNLLKRIKAIADTGLLYSTNEYDKERYTELQEISFQLLQQISGHPLETLKELFPTANDYPTVKVDIRAFVLSPDQKILLVKETTDGNWSLPGGWADIGFSAKEIAVKECKEETGLDVIPARLLAVFDKKYHANPPEPFYVYKMVIQCEAVSFESNSGFDIADVQYFSIRELPDLSEFRILKSQLELLYRIALTPGNEVYYD